MRYYTIITIDLYENKIILTQLQYPCTKKKAKEAAKIRCSKSREIEIAILESKDIYNRNFIEIFNENSMLKMKQLEKGGVF